MKGYESYKESGIEWIGEIPEHWNKLKIGRSFDLIGSGTTPNTNVDKFYNEGNINWLNTGDLNDGYIFDTTKKITEVALKETSLRIFPEGSIVIALYGATIGKLGHLKIETTTNQACCVLSKSNKITNRFLFYFFLASRKNIISMSYGGGQPNISQELIKQLHLPTPSIEEQTTIASFLDYKTSLIDATIEKKKRLIELLKEKRQAVINEAVTKGLNPNAPMKDSGVEWLGDIPEHWKIRNFDSTATKNQYSFTGGPFGSDLKSEEYTDGGVRIIQLQNIGVGVFKDDYKIYTSEEKAVQLASCLIFPGDIIIAKMADPVARATIIPNTEKKYIMASDGIRLEVDNDFFNTKFVEYSVNSIYFNSQAEAVSTGTTRLRIGLTVLKKLKILAPPIEEQNLIAEKLMIEELKINSIMSKLDIQIQKLQTYRQSLISEAVTGKIDVRDWERTKN